MKNFLCFWVVILFCQVQLGMAQKVKVKKDVFSVDGVPYVKVDSLMTSGEFQFKSVHNDTTVYFLYLTYKYKCPQAMGIGKGVMVIGTSCTAFKLLFYNGMEMYTMMSRRSLVSALYNEGVIDGEGRIYEEKLIKFIEVYGEKKKTFYN